MKGLANFKTFAMTSENLQVKNNGWMFFLIAFTTLSCGLVDGGRILNSTMRKDEKQITIKVCVVIDQLSLNTNEFFFSFIEFEY